MKSFEKFISTVTAILLSRRNFILYLLIGGTALLLELSVFFIFTVSLLISPVIANAIAMGVGMVTSFLLNAQYNFKVNDKMILRFASFFVVTALSYAVSTVMLVLLIEQVHIHAFIAKLITVPIVLFIQFNLNKRVTFSSAAKI